MASTTAGSLLVLFTTLLYAAAAGRQQLTPSTPAGRHFFFLSKRHVTISNALGDGLVLSVHCKSGNDDQGSHVVEDGEEYDFAFRPSIFFNTLYFCRFEWTRGWVQADVYIQIRDEMRCDVEICAWQVTQDSLHGIDASGAVDIEYQWNYYPGSNATGT